MRHPISVQPQSTYQSSNRQLWIFIIFIRRHIGAYHGPYLIFHPETVTCDITCASFEVMCSCRVVALRGFLGRARDKCNTDGIFSHLFKVIIIKCDKRARDHEIVHMIRSHAYVTWCHMITSHVRTWPWDSSTISGLGHMLTYDWLCRELNTPFLSIILFPLRSTPPTFPFSLVPVLIHPYLMRLCSTWPLRLYADWTLGSLS